MEYICNLCGHIVENINNAANNDCPISNNHIHEWIDLNRNTKELLYVKAAERGDLNLINQLQPKISVGIMNKALAQAAYYGQLNIVEVLIRKGANLHFREELAFCNACTCLEDNGHREVVEFLLNNGVEVTAALRNRSRSLKLINNHSIKNILRQYAIDNNIHELINLISELRR